MQLLCDKADGHQARMIVPLCDHQYVVGHVFIHHVPRIFAAVFQAADAQPFALARCDTSGPVFADGLAVNADDRPGCAGR